LQKQIDFISKQCRRLVNSFIGKGSSRAILKNMGILASGTIAAKIIGFATYPIITRIYSPSDFGVLSVFTAAVAILLPFATFRYSVTIPLPKTDALAFNIIVLGSILIIAFSFMFSGVLLIFSESVFEFFNMSIIANYWWLLILGIFSAGFYEVLSYWATRKKSFGPIAKTRIWQTSISAVTQIGLGLLGYKPVGLLFGAVLNKGGGIFSLIRYFYEDFNKNINYVTRNKIIFLIKYYKDLPLFRLPSQLILKVSLAMPVLYFAYQFGAESTGQLGLAKTIINIPVALLAGNVSKAYYAEISKLGVNSGNKIKSITKSIVIKLASISIIPTIILIFFAPQLFELIFGSEWIIAGRYTSILSLYTILIFITMPLMSIFNVYNQQRKYLEINSVRFLLLIIIFSTSHVFVLDEFQTLYLFVAIYSLHFAYSGYQAYSLIINVD
jgi:O-antigen/teichoic acid export membrane protein